MVTIRLKRDVEPMAGTDPTAPSPRPSVLLDDHNASLSAASTREPAYDLVSQLRIRPTRGGPRYRRLSGARGGSASHIPPPLCIRYHCSLFGAATDVRRVSSAKTAARTDRSQRANRPPIHRPPNDILRFDEGYSHHIPNTKTVRDPLMMNKIRLLTADRINPVDTVGSG